MPSRLQPPGAVAGACWLAVAVTARNSRLAVVAVTARNTNGAA